MNAYYRAECIKPRPADYQFNCVVEFSVRWNAPYLRFIAMKRVSGAKRDRSFFETTFARSGCCAVPAFHEECAKVLQDG